MFRSSGGMEGENTWLLSLHKRFVSKPHAQEAQHLVFTWFVNGYFKRLLIKLNSRHKEISASKTEIMPKSSSLTRAFRFILGHSN